MDLQHQSGSFILKAAWILSMVVVSAQELRSLGSELKNASCDETVQVVGDVSRGSDGDWWGERWAGAVAVGTSVYMVPFNSPAVLKIDAVVDTVSLIGRVGNDPFKWAWASAIGHMVYCIPLNAAAVLKIDARTDEVTLFGDVGQDPLKWRNGVVVGPFVFGTPYNADSVLKVDTRTDAIRFVGSFGGGGRKWTGAAAWGQKVYFIPHDHASVLSIDAETEAVKLLGDLGLGSWKYSVVPFALGPSIYGIPYHANAVLKIDARTDTIHLLGNLSSAIRSPINWTIPRSPSRNNSGTGKWAGDDIVGYSVYAMPYNAASVLKIDSRTDTVSFIGDVGNGGGQWLGGLSVGPFVYGIPNDADTVLKIDTRTDAVSFIKEPSHGQWKWAGGVSVGDVVYATPVDATTVLRIQSCSTSLSTFPTYQTSYYDKLVPLFAGLVVASCLCRNSAKAAKASKPGTGIASTDAANEAELEPIIVGCPAATRRTSQCSDLQS